MKKIPVTIFSLLLLFSIPHVSAAGIDFNNLQLSDSFGNRISSVQPGQMIQITAQVTNNLDSNQEFAFVITTDQLQKDVRWITGTLSPDQTLSPAISHIFDTTGNYNIQTYLTLLPKDVLDPKNPTNFSGFGKNSNHLANPLSLKIIVEKQSNEFSSSPSPSSSSANSQSSGTAGNTNQQEESQKEIPDWIRHNAKWWTQGNIDDKTFVGGIQFMITEGIIQIPETVQPTITTNSENIPEWIKKNANWWSQQLISDKEFLKGIQFMVEKGIIAV